MCGIVGYTGEEQAAPILLDGLSKLEYRGYDSAGLAVRDGSSDVEVIKAKGRLKALREKTDEGAAVKGTCGIGHTRWATHGEPSEKNAHPHISDDGNVVAVHNGIIENYQELRDKLTRKGYHFYSETDTEVAVKLVDYYYKKYEGTPVDAINHSMIRIRGSYAMALMFHGLSGRDLRGTQGQPNDPRSSRRCLLHRLRCTGDPQVHKDRLLYRQLWRWLASARARSPSSTWMAKRSKRSQSRSSGTQRQPKRPATSTS